MVSHVHSIIDTDSNFYIDTVNKTVTTKSDKLYLVQYDHNSERFTFQVNRYIEEHDMTNCDRIEIHFTNITRNKKEQVDDVYYVKTEDRSHDNDTFFFSWLVSGNATQLVGSLKFSVSFICLDENGEIDYEWSTTTNDSVQVLTKLENAAIVREKYPDLYNQLKKDILDSITYVATPAKIGTVNLLASAWTGKDNLYSQIVSIDGVTENSQVDLTPDVEQLAIFYDKDLTFVTENDGGVVTVYAIGQKPTNDYAVQVTITEVEL